VLVPYRNDGHLDINKRYFNTVLSQCRSTVERLNGLLKARMQRLGGKLFCKSIRTVNMHIAASAVMHNFILLDGHEMVDIFEYILDRYSEAYSLFLR